MTGRNVPVRIASGVVQVHVSPAIQPVVAVAAHKRHSHAPEIPYYILSTVIFSYVVLSCGGKIPRSPFCCLRSVRHFARKTGRNAPVRSASGVVQVHASPAPQPVVAAAAHKRHSHAPEIPYYILSTVIFSYVVLSCGGKIPRSPFCCLRSVRHFARKTGRKVPVRRASGAAQVHASPAIQPVVAVAAHKRHSHNARIQPKVITQIC